MNPLMAAMIVGGYLLAIWQFGWWGLGAVALGVGGMLLAIRR